MLCNFPAPLHRGRSCTQRYFIFSVPACDQLWTHPVHGPLWPYRRSWRTLRVFVLRGAVLSGGLFLSAWRVRFVRAPPVCRRVGAG